MKKIIVAVAAICLLSFSSFANDGGKNKNKAGKHAVKKEQKVSKKMDCPANCSKDGCNRS